MAVVFQRILDLIQGWMSIRPSLMQNPHQLVGIKILCFGHLGYGFTFISPLI